MSRLDAAGRRTALDAMEELVDRFIVPAQGWLVDDEEDVGYRYYDLAAVAGVELHGLSLGLLERDFPELQAPPADEALEEALDDHDIDPPDAAHRDAFFRAWMASRAARRVSELADVVASAPVPTDRAERAWELDRLRAIAEAPLPTLNLHAVNAAIAARRES